MNKVLASAGFQRVSGPWGSAYYSRGDDIYAYLETGQDDGSHAPDDPDKPIIIQKDKADNVWRRYANSHEAAAAGFAV